MDLDRRSKVLVAGGFVAVVAVFFGWQALSGPGYPLQGRLGLGPRHAPPGGCQQAFESCLQHPEVRGELAPRRRTCELARIDCVNRYETPAVPQQMVPSTTTTP